MVLIFDGNSEHVAHVLSGLGTLICLRPLVSRLRAMTNQIFFPENTFFFFMRVQHVLSYHLI